MFNSMINKISLGLAKSHLFEFKKFVENWNHMFKNWKNGAQTSHPSIQRISNWD
jgi:hypothetical protein